MFVCDDCHTPECRRGEVEDFMRSRGKCEGCGKVASCRDCQGYKDVPLPPEFRTVIRDAEIFDAMTPEQKALTSRLYQRIHELTREIGEFEQDGRTYDREQSERETAQAETVRLLQLAAEGRREYARGYTDKQPNDWYNALMAEAHCFDVAVQIINGDKSPLYGYLPSWRWGEAGLS